jgi:hypothetical protein
LFNSLPGERFKIKKGSNARLLPFTSFLGVKPNYFFFLAAFLAAFLAGFFLAAFLAVVFAIAFIC